MREKEASRMANPPTHTHTHTHPAHIPGTHTHTHTHTQLTYQAHTHTHTHPPPAHIPGTHTHTPSSHTGNLVVLTTVLVSLCHAMATKAD